MEQLKVIFIDDDINLGSFVSNVLETEYNYCVHFQNTLTGINSTIQSFTPDIIILDVEIGNTNGIETAKNIIANHPQIPILFVSSHNEEEFITQGIAVGGNAYIPKPLSIPVLVAYIKRFTANNQVEQFLCVSDYKLNLYTSDLFYGSNFLKKLSPFEKNALELLMKNPNKIVNKKLLVEKLWGSSNITQNTSSLQNTLSKLRELFKGNKSVRIDTVRGVGYILHC